MSWFGWLTKPNLEVTVLDQFTLIFEIVLVIIAMFAAAIAIQLVQGWRQSRRAPSKRPK